MQVTTKKPKHQSSANTQSPSEKRFNDAWQRVTSQQKKNDRLRTDARAFAQDIRTRIQDKEKAHMDAMYFVCLHLLAFCSRKSLTQWQREMLVDWASEYMRAMMDNPFSQHLDMAAIRQRMADAWAIIYPESQLSPSAGDDDFAFDDGRRPHPGDEDPSIQDIFKDLFAEFKQADKTRNPYEEPDGLNADEAFFQEFFEQQQAHAQRRQDESQALKQLIKSSSVNKLFRKVAGILHPDKERDETTRAEKNRLMGELIQARNTNDVPRIFAFYAEYVGESPLQELGGDLDSATQLLERQYLYLRDQKDDILDENPLTGALYRQFHRNTPAAKQRVLNKHLKEIQTHTNALRDLQRDITSLSKLKPYLEYRREMLFQEDIFDFL